MKETDKNMYNDFPEYEIVQSKSNYRLKIGNLTIDIYREKRINKFQKIMLYKVFGIEVEEVL